MKFQDPTLFSQFLLPCILFHIGSSSPCKPSLPLYSLQSFTGRLPCTIFPLQPLGKTYQLCLRRPAPERLTGTGDSNCTAIDGLHLNSLSITRGDPEPHHTLFLHLSGWLLPHFPPSADDPDNVSDKTEAIRREHACLLSTSTNLSVPGLRSCLLYFYAQTVHAPLKPITYLFGNGSSKSPLSFQHQSFSFCRITPRRIQDFISPIFKKINKKHLLTPISAYFTSILRGI